MRIFLQSLILVVVFSSCGFDEPLKFEKIKNVRLTSLKDGMLKLTAEATFINPNDVSGKLKGIDLELMMNDNRLAHITQNEKLKIGKNTTFSVPFTASFAMDDLQNGFLDNLINVLSGKKVKLHFKGEIKVSTWGFTQTVPVDFVEEVKL